MSKIQRLDPNHCLGSIRRRVGGRFIDVDDVLLSLFSDRACGDPRRWPDVFGQANVEPPRDEPSGFIVSTLRDPIRALPAEE